MPFLTPSLAQADFLDAGLELISEVSNPEEEAADRNFSCLVSKIETVVEDNERLSAENSEFQSRLELLAAAISSIVVTAQTNHS
ncbi:MAG: hypothetical protein ABJ251_12390 [Paracoccaceae bacterium]